MNRRVLLIGSGGTIASTRDGESASTASVTAQSLTSQIPTTASARVTVVNEFSRINSWAIMQGDMLRLARLICASAVDPEIDGIIVTHGTDTIEQSAFLADLLYTGEKPVVFVGAMRPADDADPDGPNNLASALEAIGSGVLDDSGVMVLVGSDVHAARTATKVDSKQVQAIASPDFGPVARCDESGQWIRVGASFARCTVEVPTDVELPPVPIVVAQTAPISGILRFELEAADGRACVVEGYGSGNVPPLFAREIESVAATGVCVALTTNALGGGVHPSYRGDGGGAELLEWGVRGASYLTAPKSALLLAVLLAESDAAVARGDAARDLAERFTTTLNMLFPLTQ